jgi:hypothetical protein
MPLIFLCLVALWSTRLQAQVPAGDYVIEASLGDDINRAIDLATADFNFIKRPLARKRLRSTNPPPRTISMKTIGDSVELVFNDEVVLRTKPDGIPIEWRGFNGEKLKASSVVEGTSFIVTFAADEGQKRNAYRLRADGLLELLVRVTSPKLKRPVEYTRIFRATSS